MVLTIVVLDGQENFLQFLDPELCTLEETIEYGGLRTLSLEYKFQDMVEDKQLFRIGNKIWIQGDTNLSDCLYVINTEVEQDVFDNNNFKLELEEVLVELNYSPVFSQTELTSAKDSSNNSIFHLKTTNGQQEVVVDWNALNYWFGSYFNIGIVQQCISEYASRISITGTINRMTLLRQIEEETGNVFVTRYEKDILDNTIHRYLDFLNPINISKNWSLHLEYDFNDVENVAVCYDDNGNIVNEDKDWDVTRYINSEYDPETIDEDTTLDPDEDDYDVEQDDPYDSVSNEIYDSELDREYTPLYNINPANCDFRITDGENLLNADGEKYTTGDTALRWDCSDVGFDDTDYPEYLITLQKVGNTLGLVVNEKSYAVVGIGEQAPSYLPAIRTSDDGTISCDDDISFTRLPDDSYFEVYDHVADKTLFRSMLNFEIGTVHEEILDFGFNLENITYNVDETDTYSAVSPIIQVNDEGSNGKSLSRTDVNTIINRWLNLSISKGATIPMIVEKVNQSGTSLSNAQSQLGTYSLSSNYWIRPLKPTDNTDSSDKTYEFYRAIAYWKAPYTKNAGEMHISTEKVQNIEYTDVYTRPDTRQEQNKISSPKIGNTETTDEDIYSIYNQVCTYLKEHETPEINVELDVANLIGQNYNNYQLHDKIYIKLANTNELVTARVTKTTKEAHDVAKNKIEISNYKNLHTVKTLTHSTYINGSNAQFKYPSSQQLTVRLCNGEYDNSDPATGEAYPSNKLITFALYKIENQSRTFTGKTYTKLTSATGYAKINMKYDPGDYEMDISFMGDEEYEETTLTISINVGGTKPEPTTQTSTTKSKTTAKTSSKKKTVKTYWTKCGLSPDKKQIVSIAQPSSADASKYKYNQLWRTVFKNYCPNCKIWGTLRFDGGKRNKCIKSAGAHGRGYKIGVPEHEITCAHCDSDYCGVTGLEKSYGHTGRLRTVKKPVKSNKSEFNQLVKGKLLHSTKQVTVKSKSYTNTKSRNIRKKGIAASVKKQAQSIVKNKTGMPAMKAIVAWCDKKIKYARYANFKRNAASVLKHKSANCCDGTRFFFELCDAAGLCEYFDFYYVHVPGHVYAIVVTKKTKKWRYVDMASDYHTCWGYVCKGYSHGSKTSKYPNLPF